MASKMLLLGQGGKARPTVRKVNMNKSQYLIRFGALDRFAPDDFQRATCRYVGQVGHLQCGVCRKHKKPRFMCGCIAKQKQPKVKLCHH